MASHAKLIFLFVAACFLVISLANDNGANAPVNKVVIEARDDQISTVIITDYDCSATSMPVPMTSPASETSGGPSASQESTAPGETPITSEVPVPSPLTGLNPGGPIKTSSPGAVPAGGGASVTIGTCVGCPSSTEVPGQSFPTTGPTSTAPTGRGGVNTPGKQTSEKTATSAVQSSPPSSSFATVPTTFSGTPTSSPSTPQSNGGSSLKEIRAVGLAMVAALVM